MIAMYENQEAFALAAKRVKSRIERAKQLKVDTLDGEGLKALVEDLSLAKAVETEQPVDAVRKGQEFYVQTLIDVLAKDIHEVVKLEYDQATLELGSEEQVITILESLKAA